ncbi:hypothetical protein [Caenibacillus caldisaponilyticus]|uniref:hypothetical protein n=1 Tax=Caenibacillus caldisaponilyticus TaxID=1674942 RepID=UPI000988400B|nr:hypothetical protein [Caenibacillus caldisaponilyticus]
MKFLDPKSQFFTGWPPLDALIMCFDYGGRLLFRAHVAGQKTAKRCKRTLNFKSGIPGIWQGFFTYENVTRERNEAFHFFVSWGALLPTLHIAGFIDDDTEEADRAHFDIF